MDWASVVSVAITGVVGIAGVAGTIVAARIASKSATKDLNLSISGENDRSNKAEKRRIYASCLASFTKLTSMVLDIGMPSPSGNKVVSEEAKANYQRMLDATAELVSQADLIAPRSVQDLLNQNIAALEELAWGHEDKGESLRKVGYRRDDLADAMRADLGEP